MSIVGERARSSEARLEAEARFQDLVRKSCTDPDYITNGVISTVAFRIGNGRGEVPDVVVEIVDGAKGRMVKLVDTILIEHELEEGEELSVPQYLFSHRPRTEAELRNANLSERQHRFYLALMNAIKRWRERTRPPNYRK